MAKKMEIKLGNSAIGKTETLLYMLMAYCYDTYSQELYSSHEASNIAIQKFVESGHIGTDGERYWFTEKGHDVLKKICSFGMNKKQDLGDWIIVSDVSSSLFFHERVEIGTFLTYGKDCKNEKYCN